MQQDELRDWVSIEVEHALNSLSGISLNATSSNGCQVYIFRSDNPLNSLSGISLNATTDGKLILLKLIKQNSQFPFWDFVECNFSSFGAAASNVILSIPFLGFR